MSIIEVNHVTKEYQLGALKSIKQTARNALSRLSGQKIEQHAPFRALDDVSFSIEPGEVVGIIGHNGAGKSTILKLLANISKPTSGSVSVKGKVAPLIEVGAGLVGDLTERPTPIRRPARKTKPANHYSPTPISRDLPKRRNSLTTGERIVLDPQPGYFVQVQIAGGTGLLSSPIDPA